MHESARRGPCLCMAAVSTTVGVPCRLPPQAKQLDILLNSVQAGSLQCGRAAGSRDALCDLGDRADSSSADSGAGASSPADRMLMGVLERRAAAGAARCWNMLLDTAAGGAVSTVGADSAPGAGGAA